MLHLGTMLGLRHIQQIYRKIQGTCHTFQQSKEFQSPKATIYQ